MRCGPARLRSMGARLFFEFHAEARRTAACSAGPQGAEHLARQHDMPDAAASGARQRERTAAVGHASGRPDCTATASHAKCKPTLHGAHRPSGCRAAADLRMRLAAADPRMRRAVRRAAARRARHMWGSRARPRRSAASLQSAPQPANRRPGCGPPAVAPAHACCTGIVPCLFLYICKAGLGITTRARHACKCGATRCDKTVCMPCSRALLQHW